MAQKSRTRAQIRAVIFDYGEVLCDAPADTYVAAMACVVNMTVERFRALYSIERLEYDRGALDARDYWSAIANAGGRSLTSEQIEQLRRIDVAMWSGVNKGMLLWVRDLRLHGVKTAVLSNMHVDMVHHAKANFDWLADFDCLTLSSELHMVKPEPKIYRHSLECLGVAPEEALFLDDRESNVRGAQAVGLQGIVVGSLAQLKADLQAIGFQPLPA